MVVVSDEVPDGGIQFSQREDRVWLALPVGEIPRQFGKQLCVEGAEDSLNLSSALWSGDRGVDDFKMQVPVGLGQMPTGEIWAVMYIEHIRESTHRPSGMVLWTGGL